jgi:hypothetical protein
MIPTQFTMTIPSTCLGKYNKVAVIKSIRTLTGMGLFEAEQASEVLDHPKTYEFALLYAPSNPLIEIEKHFKILRAEGIEILDPVYKLIDDLRKLGSQALLQGEDELANEILQLVLAEKLRRI